MTVRNSVVINAKGRGRDLACSAPLRDTANTAVSESAGASSLQ